MFSNPNPKKEDLGSLSIEDLHKKLKKAEKNVEAQKRSNENVGGRGIISGSMSDNLLAYYQREKDVFEEEIRNRSSTSAFKHETQLK